MVAERSSMPCPFSPCSICESLHIGQHMDKHCSNYSYALQLLRFSRATMVDHRHRFTHAQHGTVGYDMNVEPNMLGPLCRHSLCAMTRRPCTRWRTLHPGGKQSAGKLPRLSRGSAVHHHLRFGPHCFPHSLVFVPQFSVQSTASLCMLYCDSARCADLSIR